jgi:hypothetical protein
MRMSISPQNGGFHLSTGGKPFAFGNADAIASNPPCPAFAIVSRAYRTPRGGSPFRDAACRAEDDSVSLAET